MDIKTYLHEVQAHLHLDPLTGNKVINELSSHFEEKVSELERDGMSMGEAEEQALAAFGDARSIARLMSQAYSRGSWVESFLSCQPHLIVAALFATHFWHAPLLSGAAFVTIALIAILGWRGGSPLWMYSWAGYAFFPLLIVAFLLRHPVIQAAVSFFGGIGGPGSLLEVVGCLLLYAFTLWLFVAACVKVARRDWIFLSLMLLPLPVLGIWAYTVEQGGDPLLRLFGGVMGAFGQWDPMLASICLVLGVTSVLFVRLRQRVLKAGAVIIVGMASGVLAVRSIWADVGVARLIGLSLVIFVVLISPLILHTFFGHEAVSPKET